MDLIPHLITNTILAAVLFPFFGWISLLVFMGGFFIDVDHYIYYVLAKKKLSLNQCREYYSKEQYLLETHHVLVVAHTVEFLLLMIILSFMSELFVFILVGLILHIAMDLLHNYVLKRRRYALRSAIVWLFKSIRRF